ncbi:hypothetical protein H6504_03665 [Candidatus Woesearchaeota archaeon]|nr:hypothetical protein [Candidatus Woesearchaeota archaeon]
MDEDMKLTLELLRSTIKQNELMLSHILEENKRLREELSQVRAAPENRLEQEMLSRLRKRKGSVIRNRILDTVQNKELSLAELKGFIVDEQQYCSKASFYRYIDKLVAEGTIQLIGDRLHAAQVHDALQ